MNHINHEPTYNTVKLPSVIGSLPEIHGENQNKKRVIFLPAIVGVVQVINVGSSGIVHIGDVFKISPYATSKTFAGAGSFNTGESISLYNAYSTTNTNDTDGVDQPLVLNL
ncbi:UNVERIFIED_ORG: hypothetical protein QFZ59_004232 [Bacillus sp. B2I3]|jgi:hypothetical protein|nr:hypothetical protein [Bacillus sp. B2I3]